MRRRVAALAAIAVVRVLGTNATAGPEVTLAIRPAPASAKAPAEPPGITATIVGGPAGRPVGAWTLVQTDTPEPVTLRATEIKTYAQGPEPIAIVVLVEGHGVFLGGDVWDDDDLAGTGAGETDGFRGVLDDVIPAIDELTHFAPPGSLGALAVYNSGAELKQPMGPLAELSGAALGGRADYRPQTTRDLVAGVRLAIGELEGVTTPRKALIVIGDGASQQQGGEPDLAELATRCQQLGITVIAVNYDARIGDELGAVGTLTRNQLAVRMSDGFPVALRDAAARLADRVYVTFPGRDPVTGRVLAWDGKMHELEVAVDGGPVGNSVELALAPVWRPAVPRRFPWWIVYAAIGALLGAIGLAIGVAVRRPRAPQVVPLPVLAAASPPPAGGPLRTIMMGTGFGMPVVGWLVPLDGPSAYRTYKLKPGVTRIGSGADADIAIADAYVSTSHCEIVSGSDGFRLKDAGAINGCVVNDRQVTLHDLVDNDVITLGRTHVVFKSNL